MRTISTFSSSSRSRRAEVGLDVAAQYVDGATSSACDSFYSQETESPSNPGQFRWCRPWKVVRTLSRPSILQLKGALCPHLQAYFPGGSIEMSRLMPGYSAPNAGWM